MGVWKFLSYSGIVIWSGIVLWMSVSVEGVSFEEDVRITFEQKTAIDKLRRRVMPYITENYMKDDIYLVRWLRAANYDMDVAERKFIDNVKWRKENKMDKILEERFDDIARDYPYLEGGIDKEGRPFFIAFAGDWDLRDAVITGRVRRGMRFLDRSIEKLAQELRQLQLQGKNVTQASVIIAVDHFSLVQHGCVQCLVIIANFLQNYESHFPGLADKIIFVDTPPTVQFILEVVRQNSSKETKNALKIYGRNKEQWKKVLLEYFPAKYLPEELGGTLQWERENNKR